ncbi:uncharacterized protein LOC131043756 isoform X1 [Cryptomeria japonica]|uniref:uncharacterized protein LOC131043756 isoform X1 n=1 Tax=Cryptomeria japonica TaxID=3369 RepID=UPI0027D9D9E4|nr:uncharacterized protein LOC131043756 isoform X1 [Cryptomeria japonica]
MLTAEPLLFNSHCTRNCYHNLLLPMSHNFSPSRTLFSIYSNSVSNSSVNKLRASHATCGVREENHAFQWKLLSAADIIYRAVDVVGWTVLFEIKGGAEGKVSELIQVPGPVSVSNHADITLTWLKVIESPTRCRDDLGEQMEANVLEGKFSSCKYTLISNQHKNGGFDGTPLVTEILIPVVDEFFKKIDMQSRTLTILPPKGLLELARRPHAINRLRPKILEFCKQHPPEKVRKRLKLRRIENLEYMPTQSQLQQAGMHRLIKEINAAGGIIYVAEALNMHAGRRPAGYWENLMRVDMEIECFIWECWTKKFDIQTEKYYYWNPVTDVVSQKKPPYPDTSDLAKTKGTVMPQQSVVIAAKRWDLHYAIISNGGYKAVAHALERCTVFVYGRKTSKHNLPKKIYRYSGDAKGVKSGTLPTEQTDLMTLSQVKLTIKKLMKSRDISDMPTYKDLQAFDQNLYASVKTHGGRVKVAKFMGVKLTKSERGRWSSLSVAGAALRSYICSKIAEEMSLEAGYNEDDIWEEAAIDGYLRLPTYPQVLKDGRPDLHYVLQKFGRSLLAEHLKIPQRIMLTISNDAS